MKYFVIDIEWSMTDKDTVVVRANFAEDALGLIKSRWKGAKISIVRVADMLKIA